MIDLDPLNIAAAIALCEPLNIRTIAFALPTFDLLKRFQCRLQNLIRRDTGNAEVLKYLIFTHPEAKVIR